MTQTTAQSPLMLAAVAALIASAAEMPSWDNPPMLVLVTAPPAGKAPHHEPIRLPVEMWSLGLGNPGRLVQAMSDAIRRNPDGMPPLPVDRPRGHILVGLAMVAEAWAFNYEGVDEAEITRMQEWAQHHSIADHPAGIEQKIVAAVDRSERPYLGVHRRGDTGHCHVVADVDAAIEGSMHDALLSLMNDLVDFPHLTGGGRR